MKYVAALYSKNGSLVTGPNHGDAFSKLTHDQQNQELQIGFFNPTNGQFITDNNNSFYIKKIILIRHAVACNNEITQQGALQTEIIAQKLLNMQPENYQLFSSPYQRCIQTAQIISKIINQPFQINDAIKEKEDSENLNNRINIILQFLPQSTILITHCDIIQALLNCNPPIGNVITLL